MNEDNILYDRLVTFLSTELNNKERTLHSIHDNMKEYKRSDILDVLRNSDDFRSSRVPLPCDRSIHTWYLSVVKQQSDNLVSEHSNSVYVLVDCNTTVSVFWQLLEEQGTSFVRGYSSSEYVMSQIDDITQCMLDFDVNPSFYRSSISTKDATTASIIFDAHDVLKHNNHSVCIIVSKDDVFESIIPELKLRYPNADITWMSDGRCFSKIKHYV